MKRMKHRIDVGRSGCSKNESCSIVLYFLEFRKRILRTARQKCYNNLVLKEQTHTTVFFGDIFRQIVAYCTNPTKFKIADTTNGGNSLLERESRIKTDT